MSNKIYEAALATMKARSLEAYATIEAILDNPTMLADHTSLVEEIVNLTEVLAQHEAAGFVLKKHFGPISPKAQTTPPDMYNNQPTKGPLNPFQRRPQATSATNADTAPAQSKKTPPKGKKAQK